MARKRREWYPGATYHVMSRGNRRSAVFKDATDCNAFLRFVKKEKDIHSFTIHSLCLMTNHFHMALQTGDVHIARIMQRILSDYAVYFNHRYACSGHVFEGRYTSSLIDSEIYFLEVSRYIHLNPVKAGMVREPLTYDYSSYELMVADGSGSFCRNRFKTALSELVDTSRVLSAFGSSCRENYRMFVEGKISHAEQEMLIMKDMNEDEMWLPW